VGRGSGHSRLIAFDGDLHVVRTVTNPRISSPVAIAPYPGSRLLVTERTGEGVVFDTAGAPVREWESPFAASLYATDGSRIVASRSPYYVLFVGEDGSAPLVWILDTLGAPYEGVGVIHVPVINYLAELVNAGPAAVADHVVYFAPLVRDEILRLDHDGSPVWRSSRGLIPVERDPRFVAGKERRVEHALISIAMTVGPDGRLYVLGGEDSAATRLRLDVLNRETGEIVATQVLGTPTTAIAVDRHGKIRVLDPERLLAQTPTLGRDLFVPAFALPDLAGKPVAARGLSRQGHARQLLGIVVRAVPRRVPPHGPTCTGASAATGFDIAAISDDVDPGKMRAFVAEFRPPFPILVGGGRMKAIYHYRGLPYSVAARQAGTHRRAHLWLRRRRRIPAPAPNHRERDPC